MTWFTKYNKKSTITALLTVALLIATPQIASADFTISGAIYGLFITLGGFIVFIGGYVLDFAIDNTVIGMGTYLNSDLGVVVNGLWIIIRDVFNVLFIFALIWIGFRTILFSNDTSTRKQLGMLIVAALLINFSLLATKIIVDFSNIAANEIYRQIVITSEKTTGLLTDTANFDTEYAPDFVSQAQRVSISGAFMQEIRLSSYANGSVGNTIKDSNAVLSWRFIMFGFMMMLFMFLTGAVFFAGGFLLIVRFVTLVLFMIFSPFMLAGLILPQMQGLMKTWWTKFLSNAFVAPAYLFMLVLSLNVLQALQPSTGGATMSALFTGDAGTMEGAAGLVGIFLLMSGFMYSSALVAKKMGAAGAGGAMKITGYGVRAATGASVGLAARAGRAGIGGLAQRTADRDGLLDAASQKGARGFLARRVLSGSRYVADSSFDARRAVTKDGKIKVGGEEVNIGAPKKGGYTTRLKESAKEQIEYTKALGSSKRGARAIEDKYNPQIQAAEEMLEQRKQAEQNDEEIRTAKAQRSLLAQRLNNATTDEQRESLAQQIAGINQAIEARKDDLGVTEATEALANLNKKKEAEARQIKLARANSYAEMMATSKLSFDSQGVSFGYENRNTAQAIKDEFSKGKDKELLDTLKGITQNKS